MIIRLDLVLRYKNFTTLEREKMSAQCDICGRLGDTEFLSSGCAPVSYKACVTCRERNAESIEVAALWYHMQGQSASVEAYLSQINVWENGSYVDGERVLAYYHAHSDEFISEMAQEPELSDDTVELKDEDD